MADLTESETGTEFSLSKNGGLNFEKRVNQWYPLSEPFTDKRLFILRFFPRGNLA